MTDKTETLKLNLYQYKKPLWDDGINNNLKKIDTTCQSLDKIVSSIEQQITDIGNGSASRCSCQNILTESVISEIVDLIDAKDAIDPITSDSDFQDAMTSATSPSVSNVFIGENFEDNLVIGSSAMYIASGSGGTGFTLDDAWSSPSPSKDYDDSVIEQTNDIASTGNRFTASFGFLCWPDTIDLLDDSDATIGEAFGVTMSYSKLSAVYRKIRYVYEIGDDTNELTWVGDHWEDGAGNPQSPEFSMDYSNIQLIQGSYLGIKVNK